MSTSDRRDDLVGENGERMHPDASDLLHDEGTRIVRREDGKDYAPLSTRLARWALYGALVIPVWFAIAALGHKIGLWGLGFAFGTMVIGLGPWLLGLVALLALIALVWNGLKRRRGPLLIAAAALVVPIAAFAMLALTRAEAQSHPIHDVTTNPNDPPGFSPRMMVLREAAGANELRAYREPIDTLGGRTTAEVNRTLYGELQPLVTAVSPARAMAAAAEAMREAGFDDVRTTPALGLVEGVDETFWFGFEDDVVVRVRAVEDGGSVVDIRSVSRVGQSDLGTNAERVEELRAGIAGRLSPGAADRT